MVINTGMSKFREWLTQKAMRQQEVPHNWFFSETGNWGEFAKEIHQVNISKGFWGVDPTKRNVGEALNLIHDEVSEAVLVRYSLTPDAKVPEIDEFSAEISDVMIRTLDLCGFFGANLETPAQSGVVFEKEIDTNLLLLGLAISDVSEAHRKGADIAKELESLFATVLLFTFVHKIDIWKSCNLKVNYNKSRPFLHGKKY
jgi:hypothetical protein